MALLAANGGNWVDAIGVVGDALNILSFFSDLVKPEPGNYKARIRVGQDENGEDDGFFPEINLVDFNGNNIATSGGEDHWIDKGSIGEETFGEGTVQIAKMEYRARNNAICMAWLEIYDADQTPPTVFLGETLAQCGARHYPSNTYIRVQENGDENTKTRYVDCSWLNDGTNGCWDSEVGEEWNGFWVEDYSYWVGARDGNANPQEACGQINAYHPDPSLCNKRDLGGNGKSTFADLPNHIIVTKRPIAISTCNDPLTYGQSILSTSENVLCDMRTHQVRELCSNNPVAGCYEDRGPSGHFPPTPGAVLQTEFTPSPVSLDAPDGVVLD